LTEWGHLTRSTLAEHMHYEEHTCYKEHVQHLVTKHTWLQGAHLGTKFTTGFNEHISLQGTHLVTRNTYGYKEHV